MDKPEYFVRLFRFVEEEDLPYLPQSLINNLSFYKQILETDPYTCLGEIRCHRLVRKPLNNNFYAMEITDLGVVYRLVYKIYERKKKVEIFSFDVHDSAYDKATHRVLDFTGYRDN